MRREPTESEAKLWSRLRAHRLEGTHFRRQHPIGPFVVDFCAPDRCLVIEVDGSQHLDHEEYDHDRTKYLESKGYCVLRFWNDEVIRDIDTVMEVILDALEERK